MPRVLIGTSSWTDKSLIESGKFYPATATTPEDRLRFYASQFPIVENDSSTTSAVRWKSLREPKCSRHELRWRERSSAVVMSLPRFSKASIASASVRTRE